MVIRKSETSRMQGIVRHMFQSLEDVAVTVPATEQPENSADAPDFRAVEEELNRVQEKSFREGFAQGEKVGFEKASQALRPHIERFAGLVASIHDQQARLLKQAEDSVMTLVFKIVEKILGAEELQRLHIDESRLRAIVKDALNRFANSTKYQIRMNKETAEAFEKFKPELFQSLNRDVDLRVVEDPSLKPGECLIESEHGVMDARFDSQLNEIKKAFSQQQETHGHGNGEI